MNNRKKIKTLKRILKQYQERGEHVHTLTCVKIITDEQLQEVLKGGKPMQNLTDNLMKRLSELLISEEYVKIAIEPSKVLGNHNRAYVELKVLAKEDVETI